MLGDAKIYLLTNTLCSAYPPREWTIINERFRGQI